MPRSTLYIKQILDWADSHKQRTGKWPEAASGRVHGTIDERWVNIDQCMRKGLRGLRPGNSLAKLLAERRGKRNRKQLPKYTLRRILEWADAFHKRTGKWPITKSGPILDAQGEIWLAVDIALRKGQRGLPGGTSLAQLLDRRRPVQNRLTVPRLSNRQVLKCRRFSHKNGELADRIQRQSLTGSFGNVGRHRYSTETRQPRASRWKLTVQASGKTPRDRAASTVSPSHQFSALDASEFDRC